MSWDLPQALVDWAQVVGAVLGFVALVVALVALLSERRRTRTERRRQHELEILRDIGDMLVIEDVDRRALGTRLRTLPPSTDFPLTRAALKIRVSEQESRDFRHHFDKHQQDQAENGAATSPAIDDAAARWQFVVFNKPGDACILRRELDAAIDRQINTW